MADELDEEIFTCMVCGGKFDVTQGTWPQYYRNKNGTLQYVNADNNDRTANEFCCYDHCGDEEIDGDLT